MILLICSSFNIRKKKKANLIHKIYEIVNVCIIQITLLTILCEYNLSLQTQEKPIK